MRALGALGALFVVALAVLLAVPLDSDVLYGFQRNTTATAASSPITLADGLPYTRRNIRFDSHGTSCDAWLYTPRHATAISTARFPVLIMAHGVGAQKELGLQRFAEAFARAGLAALVVRCLPCHGAPLSRNPSLSIVSLLFILCFVLLAVQD